DLVISQAIQATGTVRLKSINGSVTQTATITAGQLSVRAGTFIDLCTQINNVDEFAAVATQYVYYRDADSVIVGQITGEPACGFEETTGVTSATGNVELRAATNIDIQRPLTAQNILRLEATNGTVTQTVDGAIQATQLSVKAAGLIDLCNSANNDVAIF